jgi:hypothetical protein
MWKKICGADTTAVSAVVIVVDINSVIRRLHNKAGNFTAVITIT